MFVFRPKVFFVLKIYENLLKRLYFSTLIIDLILLTMNILMDEDQYLAISDMTRRV